MTNRYVTTCTLVITLVALAAGGSLARAAEFPKPANTQDPADQLISPREILKKIKTPPGFHTTLFANEPEVRQPIAIATDDRGRLWVAENYTYSEREIGFNDELRDRIVVFEDVDHDGRFDRRTVFWDKAQKLTGIEIGFGGVWALCAPHLLFIPDVNGDDIPDGEPEIILDGWNDDEVRHNIVNGLKWAPDGWLYGRHGIKATSLVGKPGALPSARTAVDCAIWRYHPTLQTFEVVTRGTTNSWGFDYDSHGQMFFINTVIGHLWHVVPGAHYKRMYGADSNPHLYQLIDQCADHYHWDTGEKWSDAKKEMSQSTERAGGGHAHCGMMIYLGDNWPDRYRDSVFTVNLHGLRINNDKLKRRDAGYVGVHAADFLHVGDPWFRGIELITGADGGVYIADWSDVGECHENDGVHRTSGRIYKVVYGVPKAPAIADVSKLSDLRLVDLLQHKNDWYARSARRNLQERAAKGNDMSAAKAALLSMFKRETQSTRQLRAMWSLHAIGVADGAWLGKQLEHPQEHVRVWAIRFLADSGQFDSSLLSQFAQMAKTDFSGLVRLFLASIMQRLPLEDRWPIAAGLVSHAEDAEEPALPLMIWYAVEPAVTSSPPSAVSLAQESKIPLVRQFIARRLASEIDDQAVAINRLIQFAAGSEDRQRQIDILQGVNDALRGWSKAPAPPGWQKASSRFSKSGHAVVRDLARQLGVVFGDGRSLTELRAIVLLATEDNQVRRNALRVMVDGGGDEILPLLKKMSGDRVLAGEAIRGLARYSDPDTPTLIMRQYGRLDPPDRRQAINTLASRSAYAAALLDAVESRKVDSRDITAFHARQILSFGDKKLTQRLSKLWGEVRGSSAQKRQLVGQYKKQLAGERLELADLAAGRLLFNKTCAACHVLYGQGGRVGPDLTGSNRRNLDYLLDNIVDPSAVVNANFKISILALHDGRVVNGVVVRRTKKTIELQTQTERVVVPLAEIEEIKQTALSLMPDGLFKTLNEQQVADLVAYLMSRGQVALPDGVEIGAKVNSE